MVYLYLYLDLWYLAHLCILVDFSTLYYLAFLFAWTDLPALAIMNMG